MTPNPDQIKSLIRSLVAIFGASIAGWFAAKGWFTVDQVTTALNSPVFIGLLFSAGSAIWGLFVHTEVATVAAANALPAVAGVITAPTIEGKALADAVPAASVAVAGTAAANAVAAT